METNKPKSYGKVLTNMTNGGKPEMHDIVEYLRSDFQEYGTTGVVVLDNGNIVITHEDAVFNGGEKQQILLPRESFFGLMANVMFYMQMKDINLTKEVSSILSNPNVHYSSSDNLKNDKASKG